MFDKDFDPLADLESLKVLSQNTNRCIKHMIEVDKNQAHALESIAEYTKILTQRLLILERRVIQLEEVLACLYKE